MTELKVMEEGGLRAAFFVACHIRRDDFRRTAACRRR